MGGIVYSPNYRKRPQEPDDLAGDHPVGSIWQSDDGSRWMNAWVSGEGFKWRYIDPWADIEPATNLEYVVSFEGED